MQIETVSKTLNFKCAECGQMPVEFVFWPAGSEWLCRKCGQYLDPGPYDVQLLEAIADLRAERDKLLLELVP